MPTHPVILSHQMYPVAWDVGTDAKPGLALFFSRKNIQHRAINIIKYKLN
jgi:hypothetical protein